MAPKKRGGKNEIPSWDWFRAFFFFLVRDNVYFSLVAGSTLTLSADRGRVRPNFFCGTDKEK